MRELETAVRNLAGALTEFQRALNEEYRIVSKTLDANGDLFPKRSGKIELQKSLEKITSSGKFTSIQAGRINGAWRAWAPPVASKTPYQRMGVKRRA
jgi:hypothetical protein